MTAVWATPDAETDADLLIRTRAGDRDAFALLYTRHCRAVERTCAANGPRGMAADLTHDTFVTLLRRIDTITDPSKVGHWLVRVARNTAITAGRTHKVSREDAHEPAAMARRLDRAPGTDGGHQQVVDRLALVTVLEAMRPVEARILQQRYMQGMSLREVAAAEGTSVASVKVRLSRARAHARLLASRQGLRGLVAVPLLRVRRVLSGMAGLDPAVLSMAVAPALVAGLLAGAPEVPAATTSPPTAVSHSVQEARLDSTTSGEPAAPTAELGPDPTAGPTRVSPEVPGPPVAPPSEQHWHGPDELLQLTTDPPASDPTYAYGVDTTPLLGGPVGMETHYADGDQQGLATPVMEATDATACAALGAAPDPAYCEHNPPD